MAEMRNPSAQGGPPQGGDEPSAGLLAEQFDRVVAAIGIDLLSFIANADEAELLSSAAHTEAQQLVAQLDAFLLMSLDGQSAPTALAEALKYRLVEFKDEAEPLAWQLHLVNGGSGPIAEGADEVEKILVTLAAYSYASFLIPPDPNSPLPKWAITSIHATAGIFQSAWGRRFESALSNETAIANAFQHENATIDRYAMVFTSAGRGGTLQLSSFALHILNDAWRDVSTTPTLDAFVETALDRLRVVRAAFAGKSVTAPVQLSLAGILLPSAGPYEFGKVTVRAAREVDHDEVPEVLSGQLSGTDESGNTTTINYVGDVLAEFTIPYEVRISSDPTIGAVSPWPDGLLKTDIIDRTATRLRMSLILAAERAHRVQVAVSWQRIADPLFMGGLSWSDPKDFIGLMPTALTAAEVASWASWFDLLSSPAAERIHIAISRIVRATSERRDAVDVLIDSVIAWENLFGTSEGEPTLRVTASLALLLERDATKRQELQTELKKIYNLRSRAVHGAGLPKSSEMAMCNRALEVAIQAVRTLLSERADVLAQHDGSTRSLQLILGLPARGKVIEP